MTRVVIVCSRGEPGRDGVGDYSVRLASSLVAIGHDAMVIAERDLALDGQLPVTTVREGIRVVRFPAGVADDERGRWLSDELASFKPDWVLLQFVCWGIADRGILDPLPAALLKALSGHRVALYCHELWLGLDHGSSLRHRWWGWRQRKSILRFIEALKPAVVLTSNAVYAAILERFGWRAQLVPLLSNIPVHEGAAAEVMPMLAERAGRPPWSVREEVLIVTIFGTVFPTWNPRAALEWLQSEAQRRGRRILFVSIGRPSSKGQEVLERLARSAAPPLQVLILGEASPRLVSGLLQEADIGMPSTDWLLLGKSGVAAAMLQHGLPMLVVRNDQVFRDLPGFSVQHPPSVFRFDAASPPEFDSLRGARRAANDPLPQITRELVTILERSH